MKVVADIGLVGWKCREIITDRGDLLVLGPRSTTTPSRPWCPTSVSWSPVTSASRLATFPADRGRGEGRGLGFDFLRHIERCAAIVHVIDCATYEPGRDPLTDLEVIEAELKAHGELEDRPRLIALNKIDIPDARGGRDGSGDFHDRGLHVFPISTRSGEGCGLIFAMARLVKAVVIRRHRLRRSGSSSGQSRLMFGRVRCRA